MKTMIRVPKGKDFEEFTKKELEAMIPDEAYQIIGRSTPEELETNVKFNLNVDEQYKSDILFAYSYYEALGERERLAVKYALSNLSLNYLLTWIGQNNEKLLDKIESMYDNDERVIQWLERQIDRIKAMILSFDQMLRKKENVSPTNSN